MSDDYTHGDNFDYSEFFVDDELITLEQAMKRIKELENDIERLMSEAVDREAYIKELEDMLHKILELTEYGGPFWHEVWEEADKLLNKEDSDG